MVDGRLLSNHRSGHYQNCLLKMSYLFDGRTRLGYYMLKKVIKTVSRGRGDTRRYRVGGGRGTPNSERAPTRGKLADDVSVDFLPKTSLAKRDLYIQIAPAKYFPLSFRRRSYFSRDFTRREHTPGERRISRNYGFLRYYNFSVTHAKKGRIHRHYFIIFRRPRVTVIFRLCEISLAL